MTEKSRKSIIKIIQHANKVIDYVKGMTQEQFEQQSLTFEAVAFNVSQIGELAKLVDQDTIEKYDPDAPAPKLPQDYPMPDPTLTMEDMHNYGYTDGDMLPLSRERAVELFEQNVSVYMLLAGNGAGMVFDREDIDAHGGMFAVSRVEWDACRDSFIQQQPCTYAIYQLKHGEENRDYSFRPLSELQSAGLSIERDRYELKYSDVMTEQGDMIDRLNSLYQRFNVDHPADFTGHSLSVSDIIVLRQPGAITYHYVDSWGFKELSPDFKPLGNPLRNAEMAVEDDYGMIDGIINNGPKQPSVAELRRSAEQVPEASPAGGEAQVKAGQAISLFDLANAVHAEKQDKRKSVLEQLKAPAKQQEHHRTAPKGAEMER